MAKRKLPTQDYLTFSNPSHEKAVYDGDKDRNLVEELYRKNWQSEAIDQYEKSLGISVPKKKENLKFKTRVFSPDYEKDAGLLEQLYNDPKYSIVYSKDNWTPEGLYKVFIIYSENLDYKSPEDITKEIAEGK